MMTTWVMAVPARIGVETSSCRRLLAAEQARDIAGQHVGLEIHQIADPEQPEGGVRRGVRDDVHAEASAGHLVDRERHAIERNRALGGDEALEILGRLELPTRSVAPGLGRDDAREPIDMAVDEMPAQLV